MRVESIRNVWPVAVALATLALAPAGCAREQPAGATPNAACAWL